MPKDVKATEESNIGKSNLVNEVEVFLKIQIFSLELIQPARKMYEFLGECDTFSKDEF